jgi:hypothetical protein
MKRMTCNELGGACNEEFNAETFEEIAELSKKHGIEMYTIDDTKHIQAMKEMMILMKSPDAMKDWFENKKIEFESLQNIDN